MAAFVYEMYNSRSFSLGKDTIGGQLEYVVYGDIGATGADDAGVRVAIEATAPATFPGVSGLVRDTIETRTLGGRLWYATVRYIPDGSPLYPQVGIPGPIIGPPAAPGLETPLGADVAFDLTAQTEHITQSLETISKTRRGGGLAADNKRTIGVTKDGEVLGCDRIKPYLEWSTSKTFKYITMAYLDTLSNLVGTTNTGIFYGHEAGTILFMGASGNTKDLSHCVVTFKFAKQKNRTAIEICDDLTVPAKKGWEYLWVSYKNVDNANQLTQQPESAYVEKIYEEGDYSTMGIG